MGHDNKNLACFFIYHRTGIAAGIGPIVPNNLLLAPGLSAVFGTFEQNINIPCIAPMIFTTLAKSQDRSLGSGHQRRYPVSIIIAFSRTEQSKLPFGTRRFPGLLNQRSEERRVGRECD